ncbi:hypothetical protein N7481_011594 [Penicillium waksmanii]|uniref:uncharacterized protein n=1 Tax=Penicillium waksmanii TaxID=69791 RepID=UPI0025486F89|nr:uncharacterized protein N7481_011594 [Penicillium waksmanii]KAJ5974384.1 hypothetical protein N7481_011594 [Penicillium waksmanii]
MGYACRIHLSNPSPKLEGNEFLQAEEEANTWWGIAICERTFFCELDDFDQPFAARFPDIHTQLPRDTYSPNNDNQFKTSQSTDTAEDTVRSGGYACIAQAAWLLDQVFKTIELTDIDAKLIQLDGLDHTLRTFLAIVMERSEGKWGKFCTANAILIRALFTLHWEILTQVQEMTHCRHKSPEEWHKTSSSALDTLVKIMEDIAATQNGHSISVVESLPPSRAYLMRAALRHIEDAEIKSETWEQTKTQLELSLAQFDQRWGANV